MRELGGGKSSFSSSSDDGNGTVVRAAWAQGLRRSRMSDPDLLGRGEAGVFFFDEDTGVLTLAVQFGLGGNMWVLSGFFS